MGGLDLKIDWDKLAAAATVATDGWIGDNKRDQLVSRPLWRANTQAS